MYAISMYWQLFLFQLADMSDFCQIQDCETPKRRTTDKQGRCKDETASDKKTPKAKQMLSLARQDGKQLNFYF